MTKELESLQLKVALIEEMAAELIRLRAELAKPEQEPVLFIHPSTLEMASAHVGAWKPGHELPGYTALYAAPPQRQPLTDEEIDELWCQYPSDEFGFARAIEEAHGIKEQP